MFDHIGFAVAPEVYEQTVKFYEAALKPLGYAVQKKLGDAAVGMGESPISVDFWIFGRADVAVKFENGKGIHFAFKAKDKGAVHAFHAAALEAGATDNGKPGPRPQYYPGYYGAFVFDPVGNNIEAIFHDLSGASDSKTD